MHLTLARLIRRQIGLFTWSQALDVGIAESTIKRWTRREEVVRLLPGVYRPREVPDHPDQPLMAACLWGGPSAVVSHHAAAALYGLDGVRSSGSEITVPYTHHDEVEGVLVHRTRRLDDVDRMIWGGVPVTAPARTLVDLAAVLDEEPLEVALESALRMHRTSLTQLGQRVEKLAGRRGLRMLRRLMRNCQEVPTESALEVRLERLLRKHGITGFIRQLAVWDGEQWRRLDWGNPDCLVALEAQGWRWHSDRVAWSRGETRNANLAAAGWRVIPVTAYDLDEREEQLVARIRRAVRLAA